MSKIVFPVGVLIVGLGTASGPCAANPSADDKEGQAVSQVDPIVYRPSHFEPAEFSFIKVDAVKGIVTTTDGDFYVNSSTRVVINAEPVGFGSTPLSKLEEGDLMYVRYDAESRVLKEVWAVREKRDE
ncbi:MAG: hypothetical protein RBR73_06220 [Halothiobacillaceae bacterium]|jgi:hypothetical protein|nr:hypothetical protein [Halothiobacillaceae bacterium]